MKKYNVNMLYEVWIERTVEAEDEIAAEAEAWKQMHLEEGSDWLHNGTWKDIYVTEPKTTEETT